MNRSRKVKGFTLVEMVIVIAIIGVLSAVLIPTFVHIINNSKMTASYKRASSAANDYLAEADDIEAKTDMRQYLVVVDNVLYEINEKGELELSDFNYEDFFEYDKDDYIAVDRTFSSDEGVTIYKPRGTTARDRAIKARNDYRRKNYIDRSYYEMANYIIKVIEEDESGYRFFRIKYEGNGSDNNGGLEDEIALEELIAQGYEYELCGGMDEWYGLVYKPKPLTQLTYRIEGIEEDLTDIAINDENIKANDFMYEIDGKLYTTDLEGHVKLCEATVKERSRVQLVSEGEPSIQEQLESLFNKGYMREPMRIDNVDSEAVSKITEVNRELPVYKDIKCYAIYYGFYDSIGTYHKWTEYRKEIYKSEQLINNLEYKAKIVATDIEILVVSDTVTEIGLRAFSNYSRLRKIIIQENIEKIALNPFGNGVIEEILIDERNGKYVDYNHTAIVEKTAKGEELVTGTKGLLIGSEGKLPESIEVIRDYAFESSDIENIDIVGKEIGKGIFKNCVSLMSVAHDIIGIIPDEMFSGCVSLQYFTMPEMLEEIGEKSFERCISLTRLDLPITLNRIKVGAYDGCEGKKLTLNYASSRKVFNKLVTNEAELTSNVTMNYLLKDIDYVLDEGVVSEETPNPELLDPRLDTILEINSPDKGYRHLFSGWTVRGTLTENYYDDLIEREGTTVSELKQSDYPEDITLTAIYERIVFNISYKVDGVTRANDDEELKNHAKEYNTKSTKNITIPELTKKGYEFEGWYLGQSKIGTTFVPTGRIGDVILTSKFNLITYDIIYDYNGGAVASDNKTQYTVETPTFTLNNPVKQDYEFLGWTGTNGGIPEIKVTIENGSIGNRTYKANYEASVYSLTYNYNGGTVDTENVSTFTVESGTINLHSPKKKGYTFETYNDGTNNIGTTFICANYHGNTELTAIYHANVYTITYVGDHIKNANNPTKYTYGKTITLKNPEMQAGYKFTKWTEEHGYVQSSMLISGAIGDLNIEAKSEVIEYTITYIANSGTLSTKNPTKYTVESPNIKLINPTRVGYTFKGWTGSNSNNPQENVTITTGSVGNKSYTANWQLEIYTITYQLNGGTLSAVNPSEYTYESKDIYITNPTRKGYTFNGWSGTGIEGKSSNVVIPTKSTGNREYVANYTIIVYKVTYNLNKGICNPANKETYTIEDETFTLTTPTKTGYDFDGWSGTGINGVTDTVTINKGSIGDKTYTANWTPIVYTITYKLNGGTVAKANPTKYTIESSAIKLNNPERKGYTYKGWTGSMSGYDVTIPSGSIGNKEFTANFDINTYKISYTMNGGSANNPTTYTVETATFTLKNAERKGYTFNGWSGTGITGKSTSVTITKGSIGDKSYTANFTRITYTIGYTLNNGAINGTNPTSYHVETPTFTLINPTRTGYTFKGWTGTDNGTSITIKQGSVGNRSYTANFEVITYTITYTLNGGSCNPANPTSYNVETTTFTLTKPERKGYKFNGWTSKHLTGTVDTVTIPKGSLDNRTYVANFSIITYTITYDIGNGTLTKTNPTSYTVETATFALTNPTQTGYSFKGWTGSNGTTAQTSVSINKGSIGNRTYKANYSVITYTISYTLNSGALPSGKTNPTSYTVETASFTLNNPTRTGYDFKGWTGSNGTTAQVTVVIAKGSTGNKSYTAVWALHSYSITYTLNGGVHNGNPTSYTINTETITLKDATRTGYTFNGWTGSNGTTAKRSVTISKGSTGNKSYTANWTLVTYTISYNYNSGSVSKANPTTYTVETASFTLNNPSRTGYNFNGWTGSISGTTVTINKGTTGNKSFTANWKGKTYTVTLNRNNGSGGTASVTATYGSAMPSASKPSRTGYTFNGYYYAGLQFYNSNMGSVRTYPYTYGVTLVASWTQNSYWVGFNKNGGSGGSDGVTVRYNTSMPGASAPGRWGYSFAGYYLNGLYYYNSGMGSVRNWNYTSGGTLTAGWNVINYSVTYNWNSCYATGNYYPSSYNVTCMWWDPHGVAKGGADWWDGPHHFRIWYGAGWDRSGPRNTLGNIHFTANYWETGRNRQYTVQSGDSWWRIAQNTLGNGNRYQELKNYNGYSSNTIHPGQVFNIPW